MITGLQGGTLLSVGKDTACQGTAALQHLCNSCLTCCRCGTFCCHRDPGIKTWRWAVAIGPSQAGSTSLQIPSGAHGRSL